MSVQTGRLLLIKRAPLINSTPNEVVTVCGLDARTFKLANAIEDSTTPKCAAPEGIVYEKNAWGVQSIAFDGAGKYDNDAVGKLVGEDARLQREWPYLVIVPGWRYYFGLWKISDYEIAGAKVGDADFSASWRLNGEYTSEEVA